MNTWWISLFLLYWINTLSDQLIPKVFIYLFSLGFLIIRFGFYKRNLAAAFILGLSFLSLQPSFDKPQAGNYKIVEIHNGYAIAKKGNTEIVVYGEEDFYWQDEYKITKFTPVHSRTNEGQFSFMNAMKRRHIVYQADGKLSQPVSHKETLPNQILKKIREHPLKEWYLMFFYGIRSDTFDEALCTLGLPVLGFLGLLSSFMRKHQKQHHIWWVKTLFLAVWGYFFGWTTSIWRMAVFVLIKEAVKPDCLKTPASIFVFCLFFPLQSREFAFVLPSLMALNRQFGLTGRKGKGMNYLLSAGLSILYFSKLSIWSMLAFSAGRKVMGYLFLISCLMFFIPYYGWTDWIKPIFQWWGQISAPLLDLMAHPLFIALFFAAIYAYWLKPAMKGKLLAAALIMSVGFFWMDPFFHVYVLDVGQGDCTIIQEPFGQSAIIIDAAGSAYTDLYTRTIGPFLKDHGIVPTAVIKTHDDLDHSGSVDAILKDYPNCRLIEDSSTPIPVSYSFHSLLPSRQVDADNENDKSIVSWFEYDGIRYLWMGDASVNIEEQLLEEYDVECHILKLGHHGSDTSSKFDFLLKTNPDLAVITAGYKNRYNHPSKSVMKSLEELNITPLMTKEDGSLHFFSWHGFLFFHSAQNRFGLLKTPWSQ